MNRKKIDCLFSNINKSETGQYCQLIFNKNDLAHQSNPEIVIFEDYSDDISCRIEESTKIYSEKAKGRVIDIYQIKISYAGCKKELYIAHDFEDNNSCLCCIKEIS